MIIPTEVRKALGLSPGGLLEFTIEDNGEVLVAAAVRKPSTNSDDEILEHVSGA
ncbi:MAG: AbrB/MazE/SpoVT family DNA-binding domain-containing protein [Rhizobiaceae bacterium]|nr:AbrB/MazE/SpoVT family DNA-binding domain-containing protein [Rhizobiaceae bacterium]